MDTKRIKKMMTEFSQELGIEAPKANSMGRKMLWAMAGLAGFSLIRGMMKKK
ncbi:MAG TPA: hypothetical protein PK830_02775 [Candidatus Atribacteria bacterium]|nr:hypothetical protein [Candidatus Atribacteria bacterium]HPT78015.1 hypothetical protein [Candidatus Atribacteria bacterium]